MKQKKRSDTNTQKKVLAEHIYRPWLAFGHFQTVRIKGFACGLCVYLLMRQVATFFI